MTAEVSLSPVKIAHACNTVAIPVIEASPIYEQAHSIKAIWRNEQLKHGNILKFRTDDERRDRRHRSNLSRCRTSH